MYKIIRKTQTIILLYLIIFFISCQVKDESARFFPKVSTLEVTEITENGVVFRGIIDGFPLTDIVDYGFTYGIEGSYNKSKISLGSLSTSNMLISSTFILSGQPGYFWNAKT